MKVLYEARSYRMKYSPPDPSDAHGYHTYTFKRSSGLDGRIDIAHNSSPTGDRTSSASWSVQHAPGEHPTTDPGDGHHPDVKDFSRILKTVRVALRHHMKVVNPKHLKYSSVTDGKDWQAARNREKIGRKDIPQDIRNRKLSIYKKFLGKHFEKHGYRLSRATTHTHVWSRL